MGESERQRGRMQDAGRVRGEGEGGKERGMGKWEIEDGGRVREEERGGGGEEKGDNIL